MNRFNSLPFVDFLFILTCYLMSLVFLLFLQISPSKDTGEIKAHGEFMVSLDWPEGVNHDVDLWVKDPHQNVVYFSVMSSGLMNLEKDDRGTQNETYTDEFGREISVQMNREVVVLRGCIPGEYEVMAHVYSLRGDPPPPEKMLLKYEVSDLNPYKVCCKGESSYHRLGEEVSLVRFTLDKDGNFVSFNNMPSDFITRGGGEN